MLETKDYIIGELETILNSRGKQAVDRKLARYGIEFSSHGGGISRVYSLLKINDPFKVFCITEFGMAANCDFDRMRYFFYFLLCGEWLESLPIVQMPEFLAKEVNIQVSRQTLAAWMQKLNASTYFMFSDSDVKYYKRKNDDAGGCICTEIDHGSYKKAWQIYFGVKEKTGDTRFAYCRMYEFLDGHPFKKQILKANAFFLKEIDYLIDLLTDWFLSHELNK